MISMKWRSWGEEGLQSGLQRQLQTVGEQVSQCCAFDFCVVYICPPSAGVAGFPSPTHG